MNRIYRIRLWHTQKQLTVGSVGAYGHTPLHRQLTTTRVLPGLLNLSCKSCSSVKSLISTLLFTHSFGRRPKKKEGYIEGITKAIEKLSKVYTWRTQKDKQVRRKHAEREGKVFSWDASIDHPDEEPGCRCWAMAHEYSYVQDIKYHHYALRILG